MAATVEGIITVDKPTRLTSHDVVGILRRITGIRRIGHTGTLDPLATGLLILCLGRATRLAEYLAELSKEYVATIRLGQETSTYDAEGELVAEMPVRIGRQDLIGALDQFRGEITQIPPMFSAAKKDGKPLYQHARQGVVVERSARQVNVYQLDLLHWDPPYSKLAITCSSGTYVRSIAHDLGQHLGCGAHVNALRRTAVGDFLVEDASPLEVLNEGNWRDHVQPVDVAVRHLPTLTLSVDDALKLYQGQQLPQQDGQPEAALVRVYDKEGCFVGIVASMDGQWRPRKILYQPTD